MPKRRPKIHDITLAAMSRVKMADLRVQAFRFAVQGLNSFSSNKALDDAKDIIFGKLWEQKARAYEDVFMFGMFSDKNKKDIMLKTLDMLLEENSSLGHYFRQDTPFSSANYNEEVERELREELEKERLELQGKNSEPWHDRFDERGSKDGA